MTIRATYSALMASAAYSGPVRVSVSGLMAVVGTPGFVAATNTKLMATVGTPGTAIVTAHYLMALSNVHNAFLPNLLDSNSAIYGVESFTIELTASPTPESNPYRPAIPESIIAIDAEMYDYTRENQEILREQHNLTQAGDTTFPWQLLIKPHDDKLYNLGSISRFYHEDYGTLRARYVQFDAINPSLPVACPVGFLKTAPRFEWVVTNQLLHSDPILAAGINASLVQPVDGQFGWVVIDGPNLQAIENVGTGLAVGESFGWAEDGKIGPAALGITLARRVAKLKTAALIPGSAWIHTESFSLAAVSAHVAAITANLANDIAALENDIEVLQQATQIAGTLAALNASIAVLTTRISNEERNSRVSAAALNTRITSLGSIYAAKSELGNLATTLQNAQAMLAASLNARISAVSLVANQALTLAQAGGLDLGPIEEQISAILAIIGETNLRPVSKFPVVDGSIPPKLVYIDDGSLVYTESL